MKLFIFFLGIFVLVIFSSQNLEANRSRVVAKNFFCVAELFNKEMEKKYQEHVQFVQGEFTFNWDNKCLEILNKDIRITFKRTPHSECTVEWAGQIIFGYFKQGKWTIEQNNISTLSSKQEEELKLLLKKLQLEYVEYKNFKGK